MNKTIKLEWAKIKAEAKKANLAIHRAKITSAYAQIKVIRDNKAAQWVKFRAAVKAKKLNDATAALNHIIHLKSQIIAQQMVIINQKQAIETILKNVKFS